MSEVPPPSAPTVYEPNKSTSVLLDPLPQVQRHHVIPISEWSRPVIEQLKYTDLRSIFDPSAGASNTLVLLFGSQTTIAQAGRER